jgi:hypothetical protein
MVYNPVTDVDQTRTNHVVTRNCVRLGEVGQERVRAGLGELAVDASGRLDRGQRLAARAVPARADARDPLRQSSSWGWYCARPPITRMRAALARLAGGLYFAWPILAHRGHQIMNTAVSSCDRG